VGEPVPAAGARPRAPAGDGRLAPHRGVRVPDAAPDRPPAVYFSMTGSSPRLSLHLLTTYPFGHYILLDVRVQSEYFNSFSRRTIGDASGARRSWLGRSPPREARASSLTSSTRPCPR
jgi:hypothetical protein